MDLGHWYLLECGHYGQVPDDGDTPSSGGWNMLHCRTCWDPKDGSNYPLRRIVGAAQR